MRYDLDTVLGFGKHRGKTVEDVLEEQPGYLLWCLDEIDDFTVDAVLRREIENAARGQE